MCCGGLGWDESLGLKWGEEDGLGRKGRIAWVLEGRLLRRSGRLRGDADAVDY
jgi:hypothetical protein